MTDSKKKVKIRDALVALVKVGKTTFQIAPLMVIVQGVGTIISASLPIATTYFAALTTTSLANAYSGVAGDSDQVMFYVIITALLGVASSGWSTFQSYLSALARYRIDQKISTQMFDKFFSIEFWRYDNQAMIDGFDRAKRFVSFFPWIFDRLAELVASLVSFVIAIWALGAVSVWLALGVVISVIPQAIVQFRLSRLNADHWQKNTVNRRHLGWLERTITSPENIAEIRLYGLAKKLLDLRIKLTDKDQKTWINFERKFMIWRFGADLLATMAEIGALIWVVMEIAARRQPIGQFLFIQQTVSRALGSINQLISTFNYIDEDVMNLFDYQNFMDLPSITTKTKQLPPMEKAIEIDNLSFVYPEKSNKVLKNISMTINKGQRVAIVGENGAGKTTLLRLIMGLYLPTDGRLSVDGQELKDVNIESWHRQIGVLSQDFVKYEFATVNENIWYGDTTRPKRLRAAGIKEALSMAEATKFVEKLPEKGENYINKWMGVKNGKNSVDLSGGQWQRLALARNFYRNSPIMILDEPTSAIDALAEARIFKRLFKRAGETIIIVSHRLTTIEKADVIYMMNEGRIVESGAIEELLARKGQFYEMFESQIK